MKGANKQLAPLRILMSFHSLVNSGAGDQPSSKRVRSSRTTSRKLEPRPNRPMVVEPAR